MRCDYTENFISCAADHVVFWTRSWALFEIRAELRARLDRSAVSWCMIGGSALAVHGYARFTADIDLLTMDSRVLDRTFWEGAELPEIRKGDWDDPLRGVVRFHSEPGIDVIVGVGHAMRFAVESAETMAALGWRVATPLGMVLLKLEAGGPMDRSDIVGLVDARRQLGSVEWLGQIAQHLPRMSEDARACFASLEPHLTLPT
jgi:hypothetical protein